VLILICVTARTAQRAFARDLDGKHGGPALKDPAPGGQESKSVHKGRIYATSMPRSVLVGERVPLISSEAGGFG
jgi:hypothetical protein